jgi:hypothetical protein
LKKKIVFDIFGLCLKNRSRLLSKYSTDVGNIQESNSGNYFNLYVTIWKVRIFERTSAIRNSGKKSATDQKRWQINKNDLYTFDS